MKRWLFFLFLFFHTPFLLAECGSIVCIHGLVSTPSNLSSVRTVIAGSNMRIYMWEYPSTKKYLQEHAFELSKVLSNIAASYPGEPIHFVTHSSGGIVLRSALNMPLCPEEAKIGRAVLFAPPNQGSKLGRRFRWLLPVRLIIGNKSGLELMTYEPCMMSRNFGCFPPTMEVLVISGTRGITLFKEPNDGFLTLEETYLETPYYLLTYPVSHGNLLKCKPALCQMKRFIERGYCPE